MTYSSFGKWFTAFMLIGILIIAGCSNGGSTNGSNTGQPAAGGGSTNATDNNNSGGNSNGQAAAEEQREHLALNWFVYAPSNTNLPAADKDFVKRAIEEKFNVELKLDYMAAGSDYLNKINVLLASTPPDMFTLLDGRDIVTATGLIGDIEAYMNAETIPNYFDWLSEDKIMTYGAQHVSAGYYTPPLPYSSAPNRSYYIRQDWLDNLNLRIPQSYEEYVNVLRAFRHDDPDRNGTKNTYGFTTAADGKGTGTDWPEYQKNGLIFPREVADNKYVDMQLDLRVEGVLDDIIKLIEEDLVDPDWFLNKPPQHLEKAIQGRVGVIFSNDPYVAYDSNPQGIQVRTQQLFPDANWVPFTMFPGVPTSTENTPGNRGSWLFPQAIVDKNPEKVERSIEIVNWLASEEGFLLTHYGVEGQHYTRDGATIKLNNEAYDADIVKQGDFLRIWSFFTPQIPDQFELTIDDPSISEHDRQIEQFLASLPYVDDVGTSLKPPEGTDNAAMRAKHREYAAKAIYEDKSGSNWPQYYQDVMDNYDGAKIFAGYEEQIRAVGRIK